MPPFLRIYYDYGFVAIIPLTVLLLSKNSQFLRLSSPLYLLIGIAIVQELIKPKGEKVSATA